jgi:hypothetical protein
MKGLLVIVALATGGLFTGSYWLWEGPHSEMGYLVIGGGSFAACWGLLVLAGSLNQRRLANRLEANLRRGTGAHHPKGLALKSSMKAE